jgi:hypothetical protein
MRVDAIGADGLGETAGDDDVHPAAMTSMLPTANATAVQRTSSLMRLHAPNPA